MTAERSSLLVEFGAICGGRAAVGWPVNKLGREISVVRLAISYPEAQETKLL